MKGLIIKELYLYKGQMKLYIIFLVFYTVYSMITKSVGMLFMMVVLLGVSGMLTSFGVDYQCKWDIYALSTPVGRKKSVFSKYSMGFIVTSVITGVTLIFAFIINTMTKEQTFTDILFMGYAVFAVTILIIILNMPFIYKLGVEKARYVFLLGMLIPTSFYWVGRNIGLTMPSKETIKGLFLFSPFILIVLSVLSIYISIRIYDKAEF